ncbi:hypothetical protein IV203_011949 [Nitzschia inconspicua]|uniref:GRIP domain-containing protein n=1 Tax=Nitzschia inconspicua TaxID=303405 RepID=A0A9K3KTA1_9STRA|nr:hypothetical protein IV203_011949 [Nitzschia inconspicua]
MWGNLAGRIVNTDLNATLEKIGNAVAPREDNYVDGSDDYEDDDEEEYEEEDDGEYEEDGGDDNDDDDNNQRRSFGLVGLLTRALDDRQRQVQEEDEEDEFYQNDDEDEGQSELDFNSVVLRPEEKRPLFSTQNSSDVTPPTTFNDLGRQEAPNNGQLFSAADPPQPTRPIDDWSDDENGSPTNTAFLSVESGPTQTELVEHSRIEAMKRQQVEQQAEEQVRLQDEAVHKERMEMERKKRDAEAAERKYADEERRQKEAEAKRKEQLRMEKEMKAEQERKRADIELRRKAEIEQQKIAQEAETKRLAEEKEIWRLEAEATRKAEAARERLRLEAEEKKRAAAEEKRRHEVALAKQKEEEQSRLLVNQKAEEEEEARRQKLTASWEDEGKSVSRAPLPTNAEGGTFGQNGSHSKRRQKPEYHEATRLMETEFICREMQTRLKMAEQEIEALRKEAKREKERAQAEKEELISRFQDKESRLLKATSEENQNQTMHLEQEYKTKIETLEHTLSKERKDFKDEQEEFKRLLLESNAKCDRVESQMQATAKRFENELSQMQQREERSLRKADDRVAQTMAILDERNEEIAHLKSLIRDMESKVNEHEEGVEEAEEELEELHNENDSLREMMEKLEKENAQLKEKVELLEHDSEKLAGLQMEITMVKEDLSRERSKNQTVVDSAITSHTQVELERDSALSELRDVKQMLAAAMADLEIARADNERIMTANSNLQSALEAFQDERQAEMKMIDEQRLESEETIKSAHEAAMNALKQTHEAQLYEVQIAASKTVQNAKNEMELLEGSIERLKSENNQMRRSLDEAIHRLQSTQEDVIDRNVMKNILLDWCMLKDKTKRHQVLEIMANLLHFSNEEKEKLHLTSVDLDSVRARVVGALAAPLPPPKADVEHLEGSNVREKWISFLMAETDDG